MTRPGPCDRAMMSYSERLEGLSLIPHVHALSCCHCQSTQYTQAQVATLPLSLCWAVRRWWCWFCFDQLPLSWMADSTFIPYPGPPGHREFHVLKKISAQRPKSFELVLSCSRFWYTQWYQCGSNPSSITLPRVPLRRGHPLLPPVQPGPLLDQSWDPQDHHRYQ